MSLNQRLKQLEQRVKALVNVSYQGSFRDPETGWLIHAGGGSLIELPDNGRREGLDSLPLFDRQRWSAENTHLSNQGNL